MKRFLSFVAIASSLVLGACTSTPPAVETAGNSAEEVMSIDQQIADSKRIEAQTEERMNRFYANNPEFKREDVERSIQKAADDINNGTFRPGNSAELLSRAANEEDARKALDVAKPAFRIGIVTDKANTLNCRYFPDASNGNNVIKTFSPGDQVGVTGVTLYDGNRWYKVAINKDTDCFAIADRIQPTTPAFILEQQLEEQRKLEAAQTEPKPEPVIQATDWEMSPAPFNNGVVTGNVNNLNCRQFPMTSSNKIKAFAPGDKVTITGVTALDDGVAWYQLGEGCFAITERIANRSASPMPDMAREVLSVKVPAPSPAPAQPLPVREIPTQTLPSIKAVELAPTATTTTAQTPKGNCDYPDDLDSRGRRCGKRAASERPGGR